MEFCICSRFSNDYLGISYCPQTCRFGFTQREVIKLGLPLHELLNMNILNKIKLLLDNPNIVIEEEVQSLWSGYGKIVRCRDVVSNQYYIVKAIAPEKAHKHPRGWNTSASHQRKIRSYQVETSFYQDFAGLTDHNNKVPRLIQSTIGENYTLLIMEDLNHAGYSTRQQQANEQSLFTAIKWLAYFHARFMGVSHCLEPISTLWPVGTYWHLATRKDEWAAMPNSDYKTKATVIDKMLNTSKYQTLVHGDAKFENLCFTPDLTSVAAVDFQYVGLGSGVKDLAYLAGSCLSDKALFEYDGIIVKEYLAQLKQALKHYRSNVDFNDLSKEVTKLYPVAWADFYRFLLGWNPDSVKIGGYMKTKATQGLNALI